MIKGEIVKKINIYSDDTQEEKKNFIISTFIWGDPISCRDYEKSIKGIVEYNIKNNILNRNFKGFHASKLNHSNWNTLSKPYSEVLNKLHSYLKHKDLYLLIYIESKKKYEANPKIIEDLLKKHLLNRKDPLGALFQHIDEQDLIVIYKRAHKMYHYFLHRGKFGGQNTAFKYYPDASGKVMHYKTKKFFIEVQEKYAILMGLIEVISLLANNIALVINKPKNLSKLGWNPRPNNQKLERFEPMKDEDSFLIQTADIISNFFLNLIRFKVGDKSKTTEIKAKEILKLNIFGNILGEIKNNFKLVNNKCVCSNNELSVSVTTKSDYKKSGQIILR